MWTNERSSLRPMSISRIRWVPPIRARAAAGSAGIPSDRAVMLVEPAGTIPSDALDPKIPVATSDTVPSPPTAITTPADRAAWFAARVASAEELAIRMSKSTASPPFWVNDATISSALTRLAPLMIAAKRRLCDRGPKWRGIGIWPTLSGIRTWVFWSENEFRDVVGKPGCGRDEDQTQNSADRISQHENPPSPTCLGITVRIALRTCLRATAFSCVMNAAVQGAQVVVQAATA